MNIIFFLTVIAATAALAFIARKEQRHKKFATLMAIAVPLIALILYFTFLSPSLTQQALPQSEQEQQEAYAQSLEDEAEKVIAAHAANPDDVTLNLQLASVYMRQDNYDQAADVLNEALQKNPNNEQLVTQLAATYFAQGLLFAGQNKNTQALASLKKAQATVPVGGPFGRDLSVFIKIIEGKIKTENGGK